MTKLTPERLEKIRSFADAALGGNKVHGWIYELLAHIDALEEEKREIAHTAIYGLNKIMKLNELLRTRGETK